MPPPPRQTARRKEHARQSEMQQERQRLAQLLHNTICQELTGIGFLAGAAALQHNPTDSDVGRKFEEIAELVHRAGVGLAEIVHGLHKSP